MNLQWPWYLLGLAALALPWLLHRFSRQNPPVQAFPSTRFLEPTAPPVSRRKSLRYRGLFLLRLLLLLALSLLFAEPWLRSSVAALGSPGRVAVIAVDTSFSMRFGDRWERAREAWNAIADELDDTTLVRVLAVGDTVAMVGEPMRGGDAVRPLFDQLQPGFGGEGFDRLMRRLDRIAAESRLPVDAMLVTDAQRSRMPRQLNALLARQLDSLHIVDVSNAADSNAWLSATARSTNGATVTVGVTVGYAANDEADATTTRTVRVDAGERTLARQSVTLDNGQVETLYFESLPLPALETVDLDVRFEQADTQPLDDVQQVPVRDSAPVSFALASIGTRAAPAARVYIETALRTGDRASLRETPAATPALPADTLHAVVFADIGSDATLPESVLAMVANGGNVLIVNTPGSLGDTGGGVAMGGTATPIGTVDESHPLDLGGIAWDRVRAWRLPALAVTATDRVLVQTIERVPLLVERPGDGGRLLILNDPLDGDASDLPLQPAFVELIGRVIDWFSAHSAYPDRLAAGELLSLTAGTQVLDPDGEALLSLTETGQARELAIQRPGLYTIVGAQGSYRLPVTVSAVESDIRHLPAGEQRAWEARHAHDAASTPTSAPSTDTTPALGTVSDTGITGQPLWRYLLPLLVVAILAESLLGNRRLAVRRDGT